MQTRHTMLSLDIQHDYERTVITMILGNPQTQEVILNSLKAEMFTNGTYRKFFEVSKELTKAKKDVNVLSVCEKIAKTDQVKLLKELETEYIGSANYQFYTKKLVDSYIQRIIQTAVTLEDFENVQKEIENWTFVSCMQPIGDGAKELLADYYIDFENAVPTGYQTLDFKIGSLQGGDFIILAGQTSMGKTCMMLNLLMNMAEKGIKVDLFSLEMPVKQIQNRMISAHLGINANKFRSFTMTGDEQTKYLEYAEKEFPKLPIRICDKNRITISELRRILLKSDAKVIFIDYLGLLTGDEKKSVYERFGDISRELKLLAVEINKPIIALHQLNRNTFDRADKRPKVSDLRDSGKIEQDADMIWFVFRPAYFDETLPKEEMQLIIAKNRHGESNVTIELIYDAIHQKITERKVFV